MRFRGAVGKDFFNHGTRMLMCMGGNGHDPNQVSQGHQEVAQRAGAYGRPEDGHAKTKSHQAIVA